MLQSAALFWFGFRGMLVFFNILLTSRPPKNKCCLSRIFGAWFSGKECGLCPSAEEVGGLDGFLYEAAQNFEVFSNMQD
jgi:hypothetical protein